MQGDSRGPAGLDDPSRPEIQQFKQCEERYRMIFGESPLGIVTVNRDFYFTEANPAFCRMVGYTEPELTSLTFKDISHPDHVAHDAEQVEKLLQGKIPIYHTEKRYIRKNGKTVWGSTSSRAVRSAEGDFLYFLTMVEDITERKYMEDKIQESERNYRAIYENAVTGIYRSTPAGRYLSANPAFAKMFGFDSPQDVIENVTDIGSQLYANHEDREQIRGIVHEKGQALGFETQCKTKDGRDIWISKTVCAIRDQQGIVKYYEGFVEDITDRKRMEAALQEREEKFRNLFNNAQVGMFRTRLDGSEILDVNDKYLEIFGRSREEMLGSPSGIYWAFPLEREEMVRRLEAGGLVTDFECGMLNKRGEVRTCLTSLRLYRDQGILEGSIIDITERKQTEQALRDSRDYLQKLNNALGDAVFILKFPERVIEYSNDAAVNMLGYTKEEFVGKNALLFYSDPEGYLKAGEIISAALQGGKNIVRYDAYLKRKNGDIFPVQVTTTFLAENGTPTRIITIVQDITDRKRAEDALLQEKSLIDTIINHIPAGIAFLDDRFVLQKCNPIYADLIRHYTPYTPEQAVGMCYFDYVPGSRPQVEDWFISVRDRGETETRSGFKLNLLKDNKEQITYWDTSVAPVFDPSGKVEGILMLTRDITKRLQAEEALRESEEKYRNIFDNAVEGIFQTSIDGKFLSANLALARMFGFESPQKMMEGVTDIGTQIYGNPEDRKKLLKILDEEREVRQFEVPCKTRDERDIWISINVRTVRDEQDNVQYCEGIIEDITDRRRVEDALLERERELLVRNQIAHIFMMKTDREMYGEVLRVILKAMDSEFGIFGYLDESGTLVAPSIAKDIWERCRVSDKTIEYPRETWSGIWGRALVEKRSLYANDGLCIPEAHIPVKRVLVVPVVFGGELIGILGVANKKTDYGEEDQSKLEALAYNIAPILSARLQRDRQEEKRRRVEEALRMSETRFRTWTTESPVGIYVCDVQGNCEYANPRWCEMAGLTPAEALGSGWVRGLHPEDRDRILSEWEKMVESKGRWGLEYRFQNREGKVTWVYGQATALRDPCGKIRGYVGINVDITHRKQMELTLKESEERYRLVFEHSPLGIMHFNEKGIIQDCNRVFAEIIGSSKEKLCGFNMLESMPAHPARFAVEDALREGTGRFEGSYRTVSGGRDIYIKAIHKKITADDGNFLGAVGVFEDISEIAAAQEALKESENKYRTLFEQALNPVMVIDENGRYLDANKAALDFFECGIEELRSKSFWDLASPPPRVLDKMKKENTPFVEPWTRDTNFFVGGKVKSLLLNIVSFPISGRRVRIGIGQDITDRKRWEKELIVKDSAIASAISGIAFFDLRGRIVYINPSAVAMLGYTDHKEILGKNFRRFFRDDKNVSDIIVSLSKGQAWVGRLSAQRKEGTTFEAYVSANLVKDSNGRPICLMGSAVDVTEQERMKEVVMRSEKFSSLEKLSAGLAHELRNPLAVISSCAQLCLDTMKLSSGLENNIRMIYRNSQRAGQLINDLLAFARPSQLAWRKVDINEVLSRMTQMALLEKFPSRVSVEMVLDPHLPKVLGDSEKIGQVFLNILINAIEAVPEQGKIEVHTRWLVSKQMVEIAVTDNGPGIPEENRYKIFDPFFTTKESGAGLGLSISHTVVEQHKGRIDIQSGTEGGTTVSVLFSAMQDGNTDRTRPETTELKPGRKKRGKK